MEVISRDFEYNAKFKCLKPTYAWEGSLWDFNEDLEYEIWKEKFE